MLCDHRTMLGLAIEGGKPGTHQVLYPAHQFGRHHRAAAADELQSRHVSWTRILCIEQGHHHGRHAKDDVSAARFQLVKHDVRVKQADQHHSAPRLQATKGDHTAACGMKHRHDVHPGGCTGRAATTRVEPGVIN